MVHLLNIPRLASLLASRSHMRKNHTVEVEYTYSPVGSDKILKHVDRIKLALIKLTDGQQETIVPVSKLYPIIKTMQGTGWLSLSDDMMILLHERGQLVLDGQQTDADVPVIDIRAACIPSQATNLSGATA